MKREEVTELVSEALKSLSRLEEEREELLSLCREIVKLSRRIITCTHGLKPSEDVKVLVEKVRVLQGYRDRAPELFFTGTVTSCLTEYVEASCFYSLVFEGKIPSMEELGVDPSSYLLGLADLVGELRRLILTYIRQEKFDEAERLFSVMEAIYDSLRQASLPDPLAPGLRRKTDIARIVVENTRRDIIFFKRAYNLERLLAGERHGQENRVLRQEG